VEESSEVILDLQSVRFSTINCLVVKKERRSREFWVHVTDEINKQNIQPLI